ncbi:MAG: hypothetical protein GY710_16020 [Desulfobacteraceae bacterium]|nr:hypothetical protein [Desulfobacteraceae bacterium]
MTPDSIKNVFEKFKILDAKRLIFYCSNWTFLYIKLTEYLKIRKEKDDLEAMKGLEAMRIRKENERDKYNKGFGKGIGAILFYSEEDINNEAFAAACFNELLLQNPSKQEQLEDLYTKCNESEKIFSEWAKEIPAITVNGEMDVPELERLKNLPDYARLYLAETSLLNIPVINRQIARAWNMYPQKIPCKLPGNKFGVELEKLHILSRYGFKVIDTYESVTDGYLYGIDTGDFETLISMDEIRGPFMEMTKAFTNQHIETIVNHFDKKAPFFNMSSSTAKN